MQRMKLSKLEDLERKSFVHKEVLHSHINRGAFLKALRSVGSNIAELQRYVRANGYPTMTVRHMLYKSTTDTNIETTVWDLFMEHFIQKTQEMKKNIEGKETQCQKAHTLE